MTARIFAILAFFILMVTAPYLASAGDTPCQDKDCTNPPQQQPLPPLHPHPAPPSAPAPMPVNGFCDGVYEGFLFNQPGALTLEVRSTGNYEQISVTGWWGGAIWQGWGVCHQSGPWQALIEFQYPNTAVQRGMVNMDRNGAAVMDGHIDGGDSFRLMRRSW